MEVLHKGSSSPPIQLLFIEDDPLDVILLKELLAASSVSFEIETAPSMAQAMQRLPAGGIDLVLCDLRLPDTSGLETFSTLHAAAPRMPVIILTGLANEELALKIAEDGAYDYVVKGRVTGPALAHKICQALNRPEN
jgi:DNA-binding NtrC family response regulator